MLENGDIESTNTNRVSTPVDTEKHRMVVFPLVWFSCLFPNYRSNLIKKKNKKKIGTSMTPIPTVRKMEGKKVVKAFLGHTHTPTPPL